MSLPPQTLFDLGPPRFRARSHFPTPTHSVPENGHPLFLLFLSFPNLSPWQKFCGPVLGQFVATIPVHYCHWTGPSCINLLSVTFLVTHHIRNLLSSTLKTEVERYSETPVFTDKTNWCHSPHDKYLYTHHQWRSSVFWHPMRLITMAAPIGNYEH
jgi:hypothetical protein